MKKFLVFILVLSMVIGTGVMVSAQDNIDVGTIEFVKSLNAQGRNPEETFNFTVSDGEVTEGSADEAPDLGNFEITVAEGAGSGTTSVNLPNFQQVGKYEYTISEQAGSTAGMTYDEGPYTLVVYVISDGEEGFIRIPVLYNSEGVKVAGEEGDFTVANNEFKSGNLEVTKAITGNMADPDDEFEITVTLTVQEGKDFNAEAIKAEGGELTVNPNGTATIVYRVQGGDKFTIENIPYDVDYEVVETEALDYDVSYDDNEDGEMSEASIATTITNDRGTDIDTGISLDNLPYIMTMVLALGGLVLFIVRKRRLN